MPIRVLREVPEFWLQMMAKGFVHITALPVYEYGSEGQIVPLGVIQYPSDQVPAVDHNNGKTVVYLPDKSVWLLSGHYQGLPLNNIEFGNNAHVPCSNWECLHWGDVLRRVRDPLWEGVHGELGSLKFLND